MYFRGSTLSTGNGLGLYVVKRAADLLKATIRLDSQEGEFTKFDISFKI
jgi:signal transduction histidine kinase